jgi:hypothetical protein
MIRNCHSIFTIQNKYTDDLREVIRPLIVISFPFLKHDKNELREGKIVSHDNYLKSEPGITGFLDFAHLPVA